MNYVFIHQFEINRLSEKLRHEIWIGALSNMKKRMEKFNYDDLYLSALSHNTVEADFQNPLDVVDGILNRTVKRYQKRYGENPLDSSEGANSGNLTPTAPHFEDMELDLPPSYNDLEENQSSLHS